jgi:pSer/pThr/pTyr-binding forkhead associated (FHA) protein
MSARLVPLIPGSAPIVPLGRPVLLVGRHPECDVRFDLPSVSRRHCCLALAYDRVTIRDLGSRHGIRVNGEPRDESRLRPGDEIAIGPLLFRFEEEPPAPRAKTASKPKGKAAPSLPDMSADPDGDLLPMSELFPHL